jgi:hypothetical protein
MGNGSSSNVAEKAAAAHNFQERFKEPAAGRSVSTVELGILRRVYRTGGGDGSIATFLHKQRS